MKKILCQFAALLLLGSVSFADHIRDLQNAAVENKEAAFGHWGWEKDNYMLWGTHSNRLIPVYTFGTKGAAKGVDLNSYAGENSAYRFEERIKKLYGELPEATLNPKAEYFDQTDIYRLQRAALEAGKKNVILVVFDGMDWQTTQSASIAVRNEIAYQEGRGSGFFFQDYDADGTTQYGAMVTSPLVNRAQVDVNEQSVSVDEDEPRGGYAAHVAGAYPWSRPTEGEYIVGRKVSDGLQHPYTDSASSATSMTAGIKTYNASINITADGTQAETIAHLAQKQGYAIGVVTSVPISHATPASTYSHNVKRHDYQDLTKDLLGVRSISHPEKPLPGVDVLIGAGFGEDRAKDAGQGDNFVPGNAYLSAETLQTIDVRNGGLYEVALRTEDVNGAELLKTKALDAAAAGRRLFGFFGVSRGHLPFQTADGDYQPAVGRGKKAEEYTAADLKENPTLAEMAEAALTVLQEDEDGFWLLVEAGDVDWANHDNNIDNSAGAVLSGDQAVQAVTKWVEENSTWEETIMIVTADHGHFLVLEQPELLIDRDQK